MVPDGAHPDVRTGTDGRLTGEGSTRPDQVPEQVVVGIGDDIPTQAPAPHHRLEAGAQRPQPILGNPAVDPSSVELVRGGVSGSGGGLGDGPDDVSAVGVRRGRVGERGEGVDLGELAGDVDLPGVEDRQGVGLRPLVGGQQQQRPGSGRTASRRRRRTRPAGTARTGTCARPGARPPSGPARRGSGALDRSGFASGSVLRGGGGGAGRWGRRASSGDGRCRSSRRPAVGPRRVRRGSTAGRRGVR